MSAVPDLQELYDEASCGLLVTAVDGTILKVNETFCAWVGFSRADLVRQKRIAELFTIGGRIFHQTHWAPMLQMQGSVAEVKFDVMHSDGTTVPMLLNARRRRRAAGEFDEIAVFSAQDRHRYERELMKARKQADALLLVERKAKQLLNDRALFAEQMIGIVSHDLRNPLSAILTGVKVLEQLQQPEDDRGVRVLGHLRTSTERGQRLIEDLLDFTQARVGSGLAVSMRTVDVHEVVRRTMEELQLAFPNNTIAHCSAGPGHCFADPDRLAQLVGNLVSNAAAYGLPTAPISLKTTVSDERVTLCVHNEGQPIPTETLDRIFEPMSRGTSGSSRARSVGLGLYIVREIARAHGGVIEVRSSLPEGTEFAFSFPVTHDARELKT